MEEIIKSDIQKFETTDLTPIEIALGVDEKGRTTSKKLYEFLELDARNYSRWCKTNITKNEFAEENVDFIPFVINEEWGGSKTYDYKLSASFAKKLAMGTHNIKGDMAQQYFIKIEEGVKQKSIDYSQLSSETIMILKLGKKIAEHEIEQNKLKATVNETKEEVQTIRNTITINPKAEWKKKCNKILNAIGREMNDYKTAKDKVYEALKARGHCRPNVLVINLQERARKNGMAKSKIDKLNILDVLENEPRLKEIYITIVKEMAIKHNIKVTEC